MEKRKEVSSDEEGFLRKGERKEVAESEGEKRRRGEDGGETTAVVVGERKNGVSKIREV